MINLTLSEAECLVEVLDGYPQNIRWTIKGVKIDELRKNLMRQVTEGLNEQPLLNAK